MAVRAVHPSRAASRPPQDDGERFAGAAAHSIITSGSPNSTGCPSSNKIWITVPPRGAGIWFMVFIASTMSSVSPALTLLPISMKGLPPGSPAASAVPTIGEITTPGCFEGSIGLMAASAPACGATSTRTLAGGPAAAAAARATRTRLPSCSISISFNPVSSRSWVSSWISSRSTIVFGDFAIAWRSVLLPGAQQTGKAGDCKGVPVDTEAGDHRFCRFRNVGILPEAFARMNIGDVDLDHRQFHIHGEQGVHYGDRCGGVAGRIDNNGARLLGVRFLNPVDQFALLVRLPEDDVQAEPLGGVSAKLFHVGKRRAPVFFRLARAEQVHIGSVEDVNCRLCH